MTATRRCDVLCYGATIPCFTPFDPRQGSSNSTLRQKHMMMMAKKSPNPTDKYVGSRVRMRRLMLGMSQEKLGEKLGLTFQQVQKYEKGTNRIGASRLQHISQILKVPVSFFFEGVSPAARPADDGTARAPVADYVSDFLSSSDGLALTKAFTNIKDSKLRRRVVDLVEEIAGEQR
jgi:transcriptional regulator with XRE-family HTH domain